MRTAEPTFASAPTVRIMSTFSRAARLWVLAVALPSLPAMGQTTTLLNFDATPLGPAQAIDATNYLNSFGITLSGVTSGSGVLILGHGYPGLPVAHSGTNYFNQYNGNHPETLTMNFLNPLSSISFFRTAMTYDSKPEWTAEALDANGMVVGTVGEPLTASGAYINALQFTLYGSGITALRINSDNHAFTNLSGVPIDDLMLVTATPEPETLVLVGSGLLMIVGGTRRRSRGMSRR